MGRLTTTGVTSPCAGVCTLDREDRCIGCGRTIDEIGAWGSMTAGRRRAIVASLPARLAQAAGGAGIDASSIAAARR